MCTVSLVASPDGSALRILMNRDEHRLRPVGQPPVVHRTLSGRAIWPVDPVSRGSWIAVTDRGLALVVMNVDGQRQSQALASRGALIPLMAECGSLGDVLVSWSTLDTSRFARFRLLAITQQSIAVCIAGQREPAVRPISHAESFASSSFGDAVVEPLRRELFAELLRVEADPRAAQDRFHRHAWPDRRAVSVMMSRADACTVSQTEVTLSGTLVALSYRPVIEGWPMGETRRVLPLAAAPMRAA